MAAIKTVIVDDEPLARKYLRSLIEEERDIQIVGEGTNGLEAVDLIAKHSPDLVFLDVQMAELDGIEVIERVGVRKMPMVVLVTAYDQYAVRAFELHAVDYLLKPFPKRRFQETIGKIRTKIAESSNDELRERLASLLESMKDGETDTQRKQREAKSIDRIPVKSSNRIDLVHVDTIDWIEAAEDYVNIHCGRKSYLLSDTMSNLEERLDPNRFARIHRSTIVNLDRINQFHPTSSGDYEVILEDGTRLRLSRRRKAHLEERLGYKL